MSSPNDFFFKSLTAFKFFYRNLQIEKSLAQKLKFVDILCVDSTVIFVYNFDIIYLIQNTNGTFNKYHIFNMFYVMFLCFNIAFLNYAIALNRYNEHTIGKQQKLK